MKLEIYKYDSTIPGKATAKTLATCSDLHVGVVMLEALARQHKGQKGLSFNLIQKRKPGMDHCHLAGISCQFENIWPTVAGLDAWAKAALAKFKIAQKMKEERIQWIKAQGGFDTPLGKSIHSHDGLRQAFNENRFDEALTIARELGVAA